MNAARVRAGLEAAAEEPNVTGRSMDRFPEFVHLLTTQANDISDKEQKKTITGDHILAALEALGFGEYVGEVQEVLKDHQKTLKVVTMI